jgi:4-aminobutyrate aminotransferase-like enzyme
VIEDERLIKNARRVGDELRTALEDLNIGKVRGRGLLVGVEVESAGRAGQLVNRMRDAGILIDRTAPRGNVLKIRPPLVFATEHAKLLMEALAAQGPLQANRDR